MKLHEIKCWPEPWEGATHHDGCQCAMERVWAEGYAQARKELLEWALNVIRRRCTGNDDPAEYLAAFVEISTGLEAGKDRGE